MGTGGACKESLSLLFFSLGNEALSNQDGEGLLLKAHLQTGVEVVFFSSRSSTSERRGMGLLVIMGEMDQGAIFDTFFCGFLFSGVFTSFSSYAFSFLELHFSLLSSSVSYSVVSECVAQAITGTAKRME